MMLPNLTAGSVNRMLDGEEVSGAVMQILGYEKLPDSGDDRYRLLISDGVTMSPFFLLETQLNDLIANKELEKFTVVRVDKCVCNEIQPDHKEIILLNLIVLVPGAEVDEKIGNPVICCSSSIAVAGNASENINKSKFVNNAAAKDIIKPQINDLLQAVDPVVKLPKLTAGSIKWILAGEEVSGAVVQILGVNKMRDHYQLLISDGVMGCGFVILGIKFHYLVTDNKLKLFTLIRIDECNCTQVDSGHKLIVILNLVVLVPGAVVGKKIGNPLNYFTLSASANANENNNEFKSISNAAPKDIIKPEVSDLLQAVQSVGMLPNLTAGSINQILKGEVVSGAVMQILGCKKAPGTIEDSYQLLISDGVTGFPFAMLGAHLHSLVTNKELEKFTLVRVDKCVCDHVKLNYKVIFLLNLVVLVPGADVGEKIGKPIISRTLSAAPSENANKDTSESKSVSITTPQVNGSVQEVLPIANLTPSQSNSTIKARVTNKTPIRTWNNSRSKGKYFSVNFLDESGEIRATGFNDAVDKFYDRLELNKVYYLSKTILETANKKYCTVNNDYEMTLSVNTTIVPCEENV